MILNKHRNHVELALNLIADAATISSDGNVSFKVTSNFTKARFVVDSLVTVPDVNKRKTSILIARAIKKYVNQEKRGLDFFVKLLKLEINQDNSIAKQPFEVVRSYYSKLPVTLKRRRILNGFIRSGSIKLGNLPPHLVKAIESRKKIEEIIKLEGFLPAYREGNIFVAAKVFASNEADAENIGQCSIDRYIALVNFFAGMGKGLTWDVNPNQPQGVVVPSSYITVHKKNGILDRKSVFYDEKLSRIRPDGKIIHNDRAHNIDSDIDYVLKKIRSHFDPETLWETLDLLGQLYTSTDRNNVFMRGWIALEKLMYFGASESHSQMIKRMRRIIGGKNMEVDKALYESIRVMRNNVTHRGFDVTEYMLGIWDTPTSTLLNLIFQLLLFHLFLPKPIASKIDFLEFTQLPENREALKKRQALISEMLKRNT